MATDCRSLLLLSLSFSIAALHSYIVVLYCRSLLLYVSRASKIASVCVCVCAHVCVCVCSCMCLFVRLTCRAMAPLLNSSAARWQWDGGGTVVGRRWYGGGMVAGRWWDNGGTVAGWWRDGGDARYTLCFSKVFVLSLRPCSFHTAFGAAKAQSTVA